MSAMPQEALSILEKIEDQEVVCVGGKQFTRGTFENTPVVFTLAGVGKVSAAITATLLHSKFGVEEIIFTGVAGGGSKTAIGDVVVGNSYLQHDLDLRPVFPQFHIFSLNTQLVHAQSEIVENMTQAAKRFFQKGISIPSLSIKDPSVHQGAIVSGDQFINNLDHHERIALSTKDLLPNGFHAIEMEGAAVAQVCVELNIPFVVVRSISDKADHHAGINFQDFLDEVAGQYSLGILTEYLQKK